MIVKQPHLMAELEVFLHQMEELGLLNFYFSLVTPLFSPQHLHVHLELPMAAEHSQLCCGWDSGMRQGRLSPWLAYRNAPWRAVKAVK